MPRHGLFGGGGHHHHHSSSHHHHHSGHHHHHSGGGGFLLGAAVGALAVSSTSSNRPRYVAPVVVETPEQYAMRMELLRQREEARLKQLEIDRLARDEAIRIQREREDLAEHKRTEIYTDHEALIHQSHELTYDDFHQRLLALHEVYEPITRFSASPKIGMPHLAGGRTLFHAILFHPQFTDQAKENLLRILLFQKGYQRFSEFLAQPDLLPAMNQGPSCLALFAHFYTTNYAKHIPPNYLQERTFWANYISLTPHQPGNALTLYRTLGRNQSKKLQLLKDWIERQPTATDVIRIYDIIKGNEFRLPRQTREALLKIAKLKVLALEIQHHGFQPDENVQHIVDFLDLHRGYWTSCFSCFFTRSSVTIHRLIAHNDVQEAQRMWNAENDSEVVPFLNRNRLV